MYGGRFAVTSSAEFAKSIGFEDQPVDDFLAFHIAFGKTVPDISLNAVANLGYAQGVFGVPVFVGDTIRTSSDVIGVKENSNGKTGVVYVRSVAKNQRDEIVIDYARWVMVNKRDHASAPPEPIMPELSKVVAPADFVIPNGLTMSAYDNTLSGQPTPIWRL